ncbi:hypothetical protein, partial [Escherichia coli]
VLIVSYPLDIDTRHTSNLNYVERLSQMTSGLIIARDIGYEASAVHISLIAQSCWLFKKTF